MFRSNLYARLFFLLLVFLSAYFVRSIYSAYSSIPVNFEKKHSLGINKNYILYDNVRKRKIPCTIYYPQEDGAYPVIIFSHGIGGSKDDYSYLGKFWAEHGYVSIHITHYGSDSSLMTRKKNGIMKTKIKNWKERPIDISFVITSLNKIEEDIPELKDKIDANNIGVAGHSFGAYTTMVLSGAIIKTPEKNDASFKDPRIKASVVLSPDSAGTLGFHHNSWSNIDIPMLLMTGTEDFAYNSSSYRKRAEPFFKMPREDKYLVVINNAHHFTFSGNYLSWNIKGKKNIKTEHLIYIQNISLLFWDYYLKNSDIAGSILQSRHPLTLPEVEVSYFF